MPLSRAVELIRGVKGSTVELTVVPANPGGESARKIVRIVRDEVKLEQQQVSAKIIDLSRADGKTVRLGVIELPSFYEGTDRAHRSATADVARLIEKLKTEDVRDIVFDLRYNRPRGWLEEAIDLSRALYSTRSRSANTRSGRRH